MLFQGLSNTRFRFWAVLGIAALAAWFCVGLAPLAADDDDDDDDLVLGYARIEEDWAITILAPEPETGAPLIVTQMAPSMNSRYYGEFQINHRTLPTYQKGGVQVQLWKDSTNQSHKSFGTAQLSLSNELIRWTQYMARDGVNLKFGISGGESSTWGALLVGDLNITAADSESNFGNYSSRYSVTNSGVIYGANRVESLVLVEVRKYRAGNLGIIPDSIETTPQTVYKITDLFGQ